MPSSPPATETGDKTDQRAGGAVETAIAAFLVRSPCVRGLLGLG